MMKKLATRILLSLVLLPALSCAFFQQIVSPTQPAETIEPPQLSLPATVPAPTETSISPTSPPPTPTTPAASPSPLPVTPTPTPTLAPTLTPTQQNEVLSVIIAGWELLYNPSDWEVVFNGDTEDIRSTTWNEPGLQHRRFEGCLLRVNMGMGAPFDWKKEQVNRTIGSLELQVEAWTNGNGIPVLTVYHYPPDNWDKYWRLELVIFENPHACIEAAESTLAHSPGPTQ